MCFAQGIVFSSRRRRVHRSSPSSMITIVPQPCDEHPWRANCASYLEVPARLALRGTCARRQRLPYRTECDRASDKHTVGKNVASHASTAMIYAYPGYVTSLNTDLFSMHIGSAGTPSFTVPAFFSLLDHPPQKT